MNDEFGQNILTECEIIYDFIYTYPNFAQKNLV